MDMSMGTTTSAAAAATSSASSMGDMDMGMGMGGAHACKISMLWNWNTVDTCFIARSWHITSRGMFAGSCIGVILLVICLEFLRRLGKEYDRFLLRQDKSKVAASETSQDSPAKIPSFGFRPTVFQQMVRALLHMCQFAVAYFVMLLAMYYNGYFIICIFIGAYIGSFIFTWETISSGLMGDIACNIPFDDAVAEARLSTK
ncbi:hypothetical protein PENANT_c003G05428 [Penicillium antarcticum]|uniref:Copper transport protein n=1 Tax=Penicillium antarcticum TaxID=416450 RepID=A0A1V6QHQ8_9EURO|nr:uncharacterized protein N7508_005745 [Penicillium antarcticum]KAJ5306730.1 hypothetical protein N7508_005745 [Penicillium antarcticum]OQD88761.1 hypothetical protein PENANT_c003G05428 [Penicillium antarcticum]